MNARPVVKTRKRAAAWVAGATTGTRTHAHQFPERKIASAPDASTTRRTMLALRYPRPRPSNARRSSSSSALRTSASASLDARQLKQRKNAAAAAAAAQARLPLRSAKELTSSRTTSKASKYEACPTCPHISNNTSPYQQKKLLDFDFKNMGQFNDHFLLTLSRPPKPVITLFC